ncbi:hypothetical protein Hamer_G006244 [Homarus americanus]|uniref:Uncharacterized protein n=1 Tax=Homarus americanus TaxID=6706 RepID=A0A8J5JM77_HOMAM|nr:hypothetical protein Hamer_G006244 [Homarus americanus]
MYHLLGTASEEREAMPRPLTRDEREQMALERQRHRSPSAPIYVQPVSYSKVLYKKVDFTPSMIPVHPAQRIQYPQSSYPVVPVL